jgi:hypothetical protein
MSCSKVFDMINEYSGEGGSGSSLPLLAQFQIGIHAFFCQECEKKLELFEKTKEILREDFFPQSPCLEDSIMAKINAEEEDYEIQQSHSIPGGIPTRGWVIAGIILLISLVSAYFGLDFKSLATESGMSFLLPIGITIGIIITIYGALFIGSHLKELSERFGL